MKQLHHCQPTYAHLVDIWRLIGSSVHRHRIASVVNVRTVYYPRVEFTIYLDRKPLYYVVNIIIPVFFLVLVVLMVCLDLCHAILHTAISTMHTRYDDEDDDDDDESQYNLC